MYRYVYVCLCIMFTGCMPVSFLGQHSVIVECCVSTWVLGFVPGTTSVEYCVTCCALQIWHFGGLLLFAFVTGAWVPHVASRHVINARSHDKHSNLVSAADVAVAVCCH